MKETDSDLEPSDVEAVRGFKRSRSPNFDFELMGIPIGSTLVSVDSGEMATVVSNKRVSFRGEEKSLTQAAKQAAGLSYSVAPCPRWTFEGRNLGVIYRKPMEIGNWFRKKRTNSSMLF